MESEPERVDLLREERDSPERVWPDRVDTRAPDAFTEGLELVRRDELRPAETCEPCRWPDAELCLLLFS